MGSGALAADIVVEIGLSAPAPPGAASPTWTDVSAYVAWDQEPIRISPGRNTERDNLTPRRCSFVLDNAPTTPGLSQNAFDPRNASGPYYGDLNPRVPVRVRAVYSATSYTLFRGFLDGGWPQDYSSAFQRYVRIEAVDALGYMANTPPPTSAFDAAVRSYILNGPTPEFWLRSSPSGWVDVITGQTISTTAAMISQDPVVDGDEESFGTNDRDGFGYSTTSDFFVVPTATSSGVELLFSCWVRLTDLGDGVGVTIWDESVSSGADTTFGLFVATRGITFQARNAYGAISEGTTILGDDSSVVMDLIDGEVHHLALYVKLPASGSVAGSARLWVDGSEAFPTWNTNTTVYGSSAQVGIGGDPLDIASVTKAAGVIDHIICFYNIAGEDEAAIVADLYEAGRIARAGDRLDERFSWLVSSVGWDHVGTVDTSGITTQQGYRGNGSTLDLLRTIEESEQGRVWVDREGRMRFSQRGWAWDDTVSTTRQITFTDTGTSGVFYLADQSVFVDDDRKLVNVAKVTRQGGREQVVEDTNSIASYGRRSPVDLNNLLYPTDRQSRAVAEWILLSSSGPTARVERIAFSVMNSAATYIPLAAQVEPGWLTRVIRGTLDVDAHVVDVGHTITQTSWICELQLDSTRTGYSWFTWGTSQWGNSTTWAF